jgi:hypothetical protein
MVPVIIYDGRLPVANFHLKSEKRDSQVQAKHVTQMLQPDYEYFFTHASIWFNCSDDTIWGIYCKPFIHPLPGKNREWWNKMSNLLHTKYNLHSIPFQLMLILQIAFSPLQRNLIWGFGGSDELLKYQFHLHF